MQFEDVESDSVVDQRVIISDDEDMDYFVANEGQAPFAAASVSPHALPHSEPLSTVVSRSRGAESLPGTSGYPTRVTSAVNWSYAGVTGNVVSAAYSVAVNGDEIVAVQPSPSVAAGNHANGDEIVAVQPSPFVADRQALPRATMRGVNQNYTEATPVRGTSPASEPAGLLSSLTRRFLPSFLHMGRPESAPVTQRVVSYGDENVAVSSAPLPTVSNVGRAAVSVVGPHPGADPPLLLLDGTTSPVRASSIPSGYSLFRDNPPARPVLYPPEVSVQLQPPIMADLRGQNNYTATSNPVNATTVYRQDEYGRFIPIEPIVSAVDISVCRAQTLSGVPNVATAISGTPVGHHAPSTGFYAAPRVAVCAAPAPLCTTQVNYAAVPAVSEAGAVPPLPVPSYQPVGMLENYGQLSATEPFGAPMWNRPSAPSSDATEVAPNTFSSKPAEPKLVWVQQPQQRRRR